MEIYVGFQTGRHYKFVGHFNHLAQQSTPKHVASWQTVVAGGPVGGSRAYYIFYTPRSRVNGSRSITFEFVYFVIGG